MIWLYEVTWHVTHTRNLCSAFNPHTVHTHSSEHTHTVNTHPEQWAAIYAAAPGEQLGVWCLAQGHLSRGIEGGESAGYSLPHLQFLPARDSNLQPFDYESDFLTIRPRLFSVCICVCIYTYSAAWCWIKMMPGGWKLFEFKIRKLCSISFFILFSPPGS